MRRTTELGRPVDTSGEIMDSGDPALDGPVKDASDEGLTDFELDVVSGGNAAKGNGC